MIEFVKKYPILSICFISCLVLMPFLGSVRLFDWDEINFAEASREMLITGNYLQVQIDFKPFWEKPPLFMWMQAFSMKLFGVSEYAARFPNAICGLITLPFLYSIGSSLKDKQFGLLWLLTFIGSFLPHFYFKSVIIDSSNPEYKIKAWLREAKSLKITCISLKKYPAYIVKLE